MENPLLNPFETPFEIPPFEEIKTSHYVAAVDEALKEAKAEIEEILENESKPSFENSIVSLEKAGQKLGRISSVLFNLNSAETSEELQKIAQEVSPKLTAFNSEIKQNEKLFNKVRSVYQNRQELNLDVEELKLLESTYLDFVRRGAELEGKEKDRFKEISIELSKLSLKFSENVLSETNAFELIIENESDLAGLPNDVKERAATLASQKGQVGKWIFTLQAPSYIPFMEYADNRGLREQMYRAFMNKCLKGDDSDNQGIIIKMIQLKAELASLLGYATFADYILEERMAEKPEKVQAFLNDLLSKSLEKAKDEVEEIKSFMEQHGADFELQRWDWSYFSEKLRKEKYNLDDEIVKPYFKLENAIEGVFMTAEKLFGITFRENNDLPKYHDDVKTYEVLNRDNEIEAVFFADFFPRDGKRGGAWMTSYRGEKIVDGKRVIPQISIVCNFTPSTESAPSLLKFDEVKTLFHEFGHALHGMLANTTYESLSGTNVYWDFVELPSQILENWCYEEECLKLFAKHYETGEVIPPELIDRIIESSTYHEAYATVRQLSFGLLDMAWHSMSLDETMKLEDVKKFEKEIFKPLELFPEVDDTNMSVQFSHIFAGGYAAGYYSYKWAEVLDADAFSVFKEKGVFDQETAKSFQENVLSKGGTVHPMELYKRFRGKEPSVEPLLRRAGLLK